MDADKTPIYADTIKSVLILLIRVDQRCIGAHLRSRAGCQSQHGMHQLKPCLLLIRVRQREQLSFIE